MSFLNEEDLENFSIEWCKELGYAYKHGPDIAPDGTSPERDALRQVYLIDRLRTALIRMNPGVPIQTIEAAVIQITNPNIPGLLASNRQFHKWITTGFQISYLPSYYIFEAIFLTANLHIALLFPIHTLHHLYFLLIFSRGL